MPDYSQHMDNSRIRWPGSGSTPVGLTPFGFYDSDPRYQLEIMSAAKWAAFQLGYPNVDVELLDIHFYSCYESAVNEYGAQINQFNIRQHISALQGTSTTVSATGQNIQSIGLQQIIKIAKSYGTEAGSGGTVDYKKGNINVTASIQDYDLQALWGNPIENNQRIEIKRVYHYEPPAVNRIYDPYSMTGMTYNNVLSELGFTGYSPAVQFMLTPIFEDLFRIQQIEFNDLVRKSAFSFELKNNKLRMFPIPIFPYKLFFDYIIESERDSAIYNGMTPSASLSYYGSSSLVSDYSNVPYDIIPFNKINSVGLQWIRRYFLALCKEVLGGIRQKYTTIEIPNANITLDGAELRSQAAEEKTALITELRENLEQTSKSKQMELQSDMNDKVQNMLKGIPTYIYVA